MTNTFTHYSFENGNTALYNETNLAKFLGPDVTFYDIHGKDQILAFLDTKRKNVDVDADGKWVTTWNDYLSRIKYFLLFTV